ncbi:MAG: thermonuclease family protein [Alphaproteobacteria bacterium]|nr:thermonuclease family protein [Alphaproteobacteria bacterium]
MSKFFLSLLILLTVSAAKAADPLAGPIPAQAVRAVDGDTLIVRAHIWLGQDVETTVRLAGIDTPELKSRCGLEHDKALAAKAFLARLIENPAVTLLEIREDKYGGRIRARVLTSTGADMSAELIKADLARPYQGGQRQPWCGASEKEPQP